MVAVSIAFVKRFSRFFGVIFRDMLSIMIIESVDGQVSKINGSCVDL